MKKEIRGKNEYSRNLKSTSKKEKGKITVYTLMDNLNGEKLKGIKVNLYIINGVSPFLVMSKFSDKNGKVEFLNIKDGNYRVIEIIDKKIYEKPNYIRWNEINISNYCKEETIYVINKKKNLYKS